MIPLTITDAARDRLMDLAGKRPGTAGMVLRIAKGKGCGGNEYKMDYVDTVPAGHDQVPLADGFALYIPIIDSFLMFGMVVDYGADDLGNARFLFTNPNESGRCGCGESFSIDALKGKSQAASDGSDTCDRASATE